MTLVLQFLCARLQNPVKHIKESLDSHSSFFRTDKSSRLSSIFDFLPQKATKQHNQAFMNRSLALKMKDLQMLLSNIARTAEHILDWGG